MKIFQRDGKINFVDSNNVLVGFDYGQCCCESFDYFFINTFYENAFSLPVNLSKEGLEPLVFDTKFFKTTDFGMPGTFDSGGAAVFRLIGPNGRNEHFLVLYNAHNGYYSHGFEMDVGGEKIFKGDL